MIFNLTKQKCISKKPYYALSFFVRGRGMIGRSFDDFDSMVFEHCKSIHTLFMSIEIDVLFLDFENRVVKCREKLPPWKPLIFCRKAHAVIEMPAGKIDRTGTEQGDILDLRAELTDAFQKKVSKDFMPAPGTVIPFTKTER